MTDDQHEPRIIELVTEGWNNGALIAAFLIGAALVVGAAVILARVGDDHADE